MATQHDIPDDVLDQIAALIAARGGQTPGVVYDLDHTNCHCNADDCQHCVKRVTLQTEQVLATHEKLYPAIREAAEMAALGTPLGAGRALAAVQRDIASLAATVAQLTEVVRAVALAQHVPHDEAPAK